MGKVQTIRVSRSYRKMTRPSHVLSLGPCVIMTLGRLCRANLNCGV